LLDKAVKWGEGMKKKHPTRELRPIVMNTEGKSVLVTRYFRPIKPPEELIENGDTSFETAVNCLNYFWYFFYSVLRVLFKFQVECGKICFIDSVCFRFTHISGYL